MAREVRIDKFRIMQLLTNQPLVQLLPPLQDLVAKKNTVTTQKKSCCGGSRKVTGPSEADRDDALRAIAGLLGSNPELKAQVKARLAADVLKLRYKKIGSNVIIEAKL